MPTDRYPEHKALNPFFDVVMKGLKGLVDGEHYYDTIAEDAQFEFLYRFPGWAEVIHGRDNLMPLTRATVTTSFLKKVMGLRFTTVTSEATVAEMDHQGNLTVLRPGTNEWVCIPIKMLLDARTWLSIRWAWCGLRMFLPESRNQRIPPRA